ncbi:MAG: hypothetical protein WCJ72_02875 [Chryseobacterium sp.]
MKYILFFYLFFSLNIYDQNHKEHSPTVAQYEEKIEYFGSITKNIFQEKTWEKIILQNKITKKETLWVNLDSFQKQMFCFSMGNRTLSAFLKMEEHWAEELKKFDNPNYKLVNSSESRPATKTEVKNYLEKIKEMKKEFAKEFEIFNHDFFKNYKNKLTLEEIESYNKKIQDAKK